MNKGQSFFKFFIAEWNDIDMQIPVAYTLRMDQALPDKVLLRDRHNNIWTVNVAKVGEFWYFVDGWDNFVQDNLLATGDLLVFKYFSEGVFNVKVYGPSATEKNTAGPSTIKDNLGRQEQRFDEDGDCVSVRENEDDDDDSDYVVMTSQENKCPVVQGQANNDGTTISGNAQHRLAQLYPKCYGMEIFEGGLAQQPRNPYFVTKIIPKRKNNLFIPMDVIKDYNINMDNEIVLVDPSGKEFHTMCKKWMNGRWVLSGGWRRLCRTNFVALEDTCICEFVHRESDQRQFLHISFVRANM